ncbi:ribonuclease P protein component [Eremococcus coleocola]|uniref:ribonuclease P protein component n=1 Tax=Eremococcus coleocola TaxID=88132 RepID=UPI0004846949|nr:ribonuclease P protein component [Eremococcus coleocola]
MKKKYRVKKEKEFQEVFHHGQSIANRQLVLYTYAKPGQSHFRVGLSVGKKMGNAVERNQIKRYLRQALHELEPAIQTDLDILLIARKDICGRSMAEVRKSMIHVMNLAHILDKEILKSIMGGFNEN